MDRHKARVEFLEYEQQDFCGKFKAVVVDNDGLVVEDVAEDTHLSAVMFAAEQKANSLDSYGKRVMVKDKKGETQFVL